MKVLHVFTLGITAKSFFNGQFRYLSENGGHQIFLVSSSEKDDDFCKLNNVDYSQIEIARRIDIVADLQSIKALFKLIRKERVDAVFGHTPKGALVAMLAAKIAGVKKRVYYRHGLIYTTAKGLKRHILKVVERLTAFLATKIVNVSPSLSKIALDDHLNSSKKQTLFGNGTCGGIDTENLFNPDLLETSQLSELRKKYNLEPDSFVIGFCGRICKDKGVGELVDAFLQLTTETPDSKYKLLLVGGFDTRDAISEHYKEIIINNPDIIDTEKVEKAELPYYYAMMDIIVLPSYREGFGMCVIEAGAMGVPALVSRSHGCVDSIVENETGIYVDISPSGIKEGIEKMLEAEVRRKMGKNSIQHVRNNFDHKVLWPEILQFYNSL